MQVLCLSFSIIQVVWMFTAIAHGQGTFKNATSNVCVSQSTCGKCLQASSQCSWCSSEDKVLYLPKNRCDFTENLKSSGCSADQIIDPKSDVQLIQDLSIGSSVQLAPQKIHLKLRAGSTTSFQLNFHQAMDYPVDIYFLMDLSATVKVYKDKLSSLAAQIATDISHITSDFRLGFGSFVDKPIMPFIGKVKRDPNQTPCEGCAAAYSFKHHMNLSAPDKNNSFAKLVNESQLSGNVDHPEGGFDALMQAIVCKDIIGWRNNSRKLVVFTTDAAFHYAGDGKLAGIVIPNDGKCHMKRNKDTWEYTESVTQDYPSVAEINRVVRRNNINVIFTIPKNATKVVALYEQLSRHIEGSMVGELDDNGDNIIDIVKDQYSKVTSSVSLTSTVPEFINLTYSSQCVNSEVTETNECHGLKVGTTVTFNVSVHLSKCQLAKGTSEIAFKIFPVGLIERLEVTLEPLCECDCATSASASPISEHCNRNGFLECGVCVCNKGHVGKNCEMIAGCFASNVTKSCSGPERGTCNVHGECECLTRENEDEKITGQYCECTNYNCDKSGGHICGGHGVCECGKCHCAEEWSGPACDCLTSLENCRSKSGKVCSNHGTCACGRCQCTKNDEYVYTGSTCDDCPSCPSRCHSLKDCVQCMAFENGPMVEAPSKANNSSKCSVVCNHLSLNRPFEHELKVDQVGEEICPPFRDNTDFCEFAFSYYDTDNDETIIEVRRNKVCPERVNLYILVGGLVGGILFIGIVLMLAWKVAIVLYDRHQVAKFQKELQETTSELMLSSIHRPATVTYRNPAYRRSTRQ